MSEGYRPCRAGDVPESIVWTDYKASGPRLLLSWGGGTKWGAPFRRLLDQKTQCIAHARYVNDDEPIGEDGQG